MKKDHVIGLVENAHQHLNVIPKTTQYYFQRKSTRVFMSETADCLIIHIQLHDSEG